MQQVSVINGCNSSFPKKSGVLPEEIELFLHYTYNMVGLKVVGVSFHEGSIAQDVGNKNQTTHSSHGYYGSSAETGKQSEKTKLKQDEMK